MIGRPNTFSTSKKHGIEASLKLLLFSLCRFTFVYLMQRMVALTIIILRKRLNREIKKQERWSASTTSSFNVRLLNLLVLVHYKAKDFPSVNKRFELEIHTLRPFRINRCFCSLHNLIFIQEALLWLTRGYRIVCRLKLGIELSHDQTLNITGRDQLPNVIEANVYHKLFVQSSSSILWIYNTLRNLLLN